MSDAVHVQSGRAHVVYYGCTEWPSASVLVVVPDPADLVPEGTCPLCYRECCRESADVGVGMIYGPWGCPACGWSESEEYDLSGGRDPLNADGGVLDQFGMYYPPGNSVSLAYRIARSITDTT